MCSTSCNYRYKSKLFCRYSYGQHPYLTIAPYKEEDVFLKPRILLYHEVLSDKEISTIKELATPRVSLVFCFICMKERVCETETKKEREREGEIVNVQESVWVSPFICNSVPSRGYPLIFTKTDTMAGNVPRRPFLVLSLVI